MKNILDIASISMSTLNSFIIVPRIRSIIKRTKLIFSSFNWNQMCLLQNQISSQYASKGLGSLQGPQSLMFLPFLDQLRASSGAGMHNKTGMPGSVSKSIYLSVFILFSTPLPLLPLIPHLFVFSVPIYYFTF